MQLFRDSQRSPLPPLRPRYVERYGAGNVSLFAAVAESALSRPAPAAQVVRAFPLAAKDPLGLWRNAHYAEHTSLLRALETLPNSYNLSVSWLRAHRPRGNHAAGARFWDAPLARAHALNALMCRGSRTVVQLHLDAELKHDRLYSYLLNWGIDYARIPTLGTLIDGAGQSYEVRLKDVRENVVTVRVAGYNHLVESRYDSANQVFRTAQVLALDDLLPTGAAAQVLGLTEGIVRTVLPTISSDNRVRLVRQADMAALVPRHHWRAEPREALRDANPCGGCLFFNHHLNHCGLDDRPMPQPNTAPYACPDHEVAP